ncbi:hypothetical protein BU204_10410 [Actinophytocola xanthii]|uniref:Uncharacterized protein n=1 Tax=Actinophytocola xanthii TaxID=1912961 RepID=A0A1Q8CTE7_9PSEU|nr:hypothetical protein BU204_10410 [Actinophytocola xanthii]
MIADFPPERRRHLYWHVERFRMMLADAETWQRARHTGCGDLFQERRAAQAHERAVAIVARRGRACSAGFGAVPVERDVLREMVDAADRLLASLRHHTGTVVLTGPEQFSAWIWTLYECAMDTALHNGIPWCGDVAGDRPERSWETQPEHQLVDWLLELVDGLIGVVGFPM